MDILSTLITQIDGKSLRGTAVQKTFERFLKDNIAAHKKTIDAIRSAPDQDTYKTLKGTLPACIFSISNGHGADGILKPSKIMQVDIDEKDNPHIADLKEAVKSIPWVSYAMYSAGGKGVFLLIEITNPAEYKQHYSAFAKHIDGKYEIKTDPAVSSPASLRFWSYDPDPVINPVAETWKYIEKPKKPQKKPFKQSIACNGTTDPFSDFNERGDVAGLLNAYGYTYLHTKGERVRYARPGKANGVSVDWHSIRRTLYVFSSSTETGISEASKGYSPSSVFIQLMANGDAKEAAKKLRALGYGKAMQPVPMQPAPVKRGGNLEVNEHGYPAMWDKPHILNTGTPPKPKIKT